MENKEKLTKKTEKTVVSMKPLVLIIDDNPADIKKIQDGISDDYTIFPTDENDIEEMQNHLVSFNEITRWVKKFISENYEQLRCIICDIKLIPKDPNEDGSYNGNDVINEIRSWHNFPSHPFYERLLPIIAYTIATEDLIKAQSLGKGATTVLSKNVRSEYLRAVLKKQTDDFNLICNEFVLKKRFKVGITYCTRDSNNHVEEIANILALNYSKDKVFIDIFHPKKILGYAADEKLRAVYSEQCDFVIAFFSENYENSLWCFKTEWDTIKKTFFSSKKDYVIPIVLNGAKIKKGFFNPQKDIVIMHHQKRQERYLSNEEMAEEIIKRINEVESIKRGNI